MAQFGKTWWGQQWLNSLNNIDYSNRLPRGSSYARKGAVTKISIKENRINAKVAGSQPKPYNVDIILPPFFDPELSAFVEALAERPVIISKMLNRELDPEVLNIAERMGLKVFPKQWTDFKMQCSCPDWAVPCKHLAAVIYKVCAEIDNDPFLVFSLHNVDLIGEMNKRGIFVNRETTEIPNLANLYFDKQNKKIGAKTYDPENAYKKLSYVSLSPINEPLTALLADFPAFYPGDGNFKEKYTAALGRTVKNAQKILKGKISLQQVLNRALNEEQHINTHSRNKITIDENYRSKVFINDTAFSFPQFLAQIVQIPAGKTPDYQPSTASLHTAFYFALHLLANGAIVPQIVRQPDNTYSIRWLPAMLSKEVRVLMDKLQEILPPDIFLWQEKNKQKEISKYPAINLLSVFLTELIAILEEKNTDDLFLNLFFRRGNHPFKNPGEEALCGGIQAWLQKYYLAQGNYKPQIVVEETTNDRFLVSVNVSEKAQPLESPAALREILTLKKFDKQRFEILQSLTQLSSFITGLDTYINTKGEEMIIMDNGTFTPFLLQMIPAIQLLDIDILLPKALKEILKPKASVKVKKKTGKSFLRLDQLLDFDWQVAIGDTVMGEEEFKNMLKKSDSLIKYKRRYIYVSNCTAISALIKNYRHFNCSVRH